jgi:integrase
MVDGRGGIVKHHLTSVFVASAKVPKSQSQPQADYWDTKQKGFGLRVTLAGRKSWMIMYRRADGRKIRHTFGTFPLMSLADARDQAKVLFGQVADGKDPAIEKAEEKAAVRDAESFEAIADEFKTKYIAQKRPSTQLQYRTIIDRDLVPAWGNRKVRDITRADVKDLVESVLTRVRAARPDDKPLERTGIMANRTLSVIRKLFYWALEEGKLDSNPASKIKPPVEKELPREKVFTHDEIRKVWAAIENEPEHVAAFVKLCFLTAQRRGEVLGIRWSEIDFDSSWWTIPGTGTKNKRMHRVYLVPEAVEILRGLKARAPESDYAFPNSRGSSISNPQKWLRRIKDNSKVDFRPHDVRRTCSTELTSRGTDDRLVSRVLNHKLAGETNHTYNRYGYEKEKSQALKKLARITENILAKRERENPKVVPISA